MYKVLLKVSATKSLKALPKDAQKMMGRSLDELAKLGIATRHVKKLKEPMGGFRKRVGKYRILFDCSDDIILVHRISKRADAYR